MRVGASIWHAKRKNKLNAEIGEYEKPVEIKTRFNYFTVMPASSRGFMEVVKSGETLYDTWLAIANARYFEDKYGFVLGQSELNSKSVFLEDKIKKSFSAGDLFWLDGDTPPHEEQLSETFGYKESATAILDNVALVNLTMTLTLKRNQDKEL